ncbi:MAG: ABC transporter substrate-binding protein [SAR202 cluster bacterium]|nr:ABC transporter substrate-binding protein [SAR202 cluster bacterium]
MFMRGNMTRFLVAPAIALAMLIGIACAPAADPTATTAPAAAPAATQAPAATAAPVETKVRPVAVVATPAKNPNAQTGGIFRYLNNSYPADFAVWEGAVGSIINGLAPSNDTLLEFNAWEEGKGGELLPNIAYDWWTNEDGTEWTFAITEGVKFHDGTDLTCADAQFMLDVIRNEQDATGDELRKSPRALYAKRVTGTSCADDYHLKVTSDAPLPSLPVALGLGNFVLLPKATFEGKLDTLLDNIGPGAGPFVVEEVIPGEQITMKRNANYWNQPYPYMDEYRYINSGSTAAMQAAYRVGRGERGTLPATVRPELVADGTMTQALPLIRHGGMGIQANWTREPWNDPRFSLALKCAIDSDKLIQTAQDGDAWESPMFPLAEIPGGTDWGLTKAEWKAIHPCHGPSTEANIEERQDIARGLMEEMGYSASNPARPYTYLWSSFVVPRWPPILEDLNKVYIEPETEVLETGAAYQANNNGEFDFNIWGFITARHDPDHWLYEQFYSTSDRNYGKYTNPELDALIDKQSVTLDPTERKKVVKEISTLLLTDNVKIWAYWFMDTTVVPAWVKDYYNISPSNQNTTAKLTRVWIDQAVLSEKGDAPN